MFCSNNPDLILSNVCSVINPTVKYRITVILWYRGWQKLTNSPGNAANPIADLSTDFLQNFNLSISSKFPTKSSKIQIFSSQTTYRTPYRQTTLKSSISTTSQPKIKPSSYQKFIHKSKIFLIYRHFYR